MPHAYVPYTGPSGPTSEQANDNVRALAEAVSEASTFDDGHGFLWAVNGDRAVTYDRWGFCSGRVDDIEAIPHTGTFTISDCDGLDQADFDTAAAWLAFEPSDDDLGNPPEYYQYLEDQQREAESMEIDDPPCDGRP